MLPVFFHDNTRWVLRSLQTNTLTQCTLRPFDRFRIGRIGDANFRRINRKLNPKIFFEKQCYRRHDNTRWVLRSLQTNTLTQCTLRPFDTTCIIETDQSTFSGDNCEIIEIYPQKFSTTPSFQSWLVPMRHCCNNTVARQLWGKQEADPPWQQWFQTVFVQIC